MKRFLATGTQKAGRQTPAARPYTAPMSGRFFQRIFQRPFRRTRPKPRGVFSLRFAPCLSFCLALCLLPLAACSTKPQSTSGGVDPATSAATGVSGASAPAQSATAAGAAQPNEPETLQLINWMRNCAKTEEGFFSYGAEVIPEKSTAGNLMIGYRLYFNNIATRQTQPLSLPDTENGYLRESTDGGPPTLFVMGERLVVSYTDGILETMRLDLSDRKTLLEKDYGIRLWCYAGRYIYYTYTVETKGTEDTETSYQVFIGKLDVESGERETLYTLAKNENLAGVLGSQILLSSHVYSEDGMKSTSISFYSLNPQTGEKEELYTLDASDKNLLEYAITGGSLYWQMEGENALNRYDFATGEATQFSFSDDFYYYQAYPAWDDKLPVVAHKKNGSGFDCFYADLTTGETAPLNARRPSEDASYAMLLEIDGEFGEYYIASTDSLEGKTWAVSNSGVLSQQPSAEPVIDPNITLQSTDYVRQYVLIQKMDYWQGKLDYIPFTLMAAA